MSKSNTNHGWRRLFHLPVLVVAVGLPLISSSQALSQEEAETRPNPYGDIPIDSEFGTDIEQLKDAGIIDGTECGDENADFCPDDPIRRRTFAVWLTRALEGDDAPDLVDPDQDSELSIDLSTIDPEVLEDMDPELIAQLTPRFTDVPFNTPEHGFIEFFAEHGITNGCSLELKKFCPDSHIPRKHMAAFFDRAFAFPSVDATGFVDVDASNPGNDTMNRLWSAKIADACTTHGPLYFCPNDKLSRGQMAGLLARAIRWREANEPLKPSGQDNSVNLRVNSYDEETYQADISWSSPSSQNEVSHYVLQWRAPWEAFGADKHEVVATTDENNYNAPLSNPTSTNDLYAVRVVTVYANGERLASNEVKVPSNTHKLRDLIEEKIIDPHQQRQPWLTDTWRYVNSPRFGIGVPEGSSDASVSYGSSPFYPRGSLRSVFTRDLSFGSNRLNNFDDGSAEIQIMVHELGHVYTMTNGIVTGEGSTALGLGHLRLGLFTKENKDSKGSIECLKHLNYRELYADLAIVAFYGDEDVPLEYWMTACYFNRDLSEIKSLQEAVAESVFTKQETPKWLYDTYQVDDDVDLSQLWSDIHHNGFGVNQKLVSYSLRNEFGGYCSEANLRLLLEGKVSKLNNHWKDGGCDQPEPDLEEEQESSSSNSSTEQPASGPNTYNVSYPASFLERFRSRPTSCWISINGNVYDVTPGGYEYPGPGSITSLCGQNASEHFSSNNLSNPPQEYYRGRIRQ